MSPLAMPDNTETERWNRRTRLRGHCGRDPEMRAGDGDGDVGLGPAEPAPAFRLISSRQPGGCATSDMLEAGAHDHRRRLCFQPHTQMGTGTHGCDDHADRAAMLHQAQAVSDAWARDPLPVQRH